VLVPQLFVNANGQHLTRCGFGYILRQVVKAGSKTRANLLIKRISPHVLRHSISMLALEATQNSRRVSLWLVHSSTQTTESTRESMPQRNARLRTR
jgi:integrase/recombinase XerD